MGTETALSRTGPANELTRAQVFALHGMHRCGTAGRGRPVPIPELAERLLLLGFPDAGAAQDGICSGLQREGFQPGGCGAATRPGPDDRPRGRGQLIGVGLEWRRRRGRSFCRRDRNGFLADTGIDIETLEHCFGPGFWLAFVRAVPAVACSAGRVRRKRPRGRPANRLPRAQVEALHGIYLGGTPDRRGPWSIPELAEAGWQLLGYPNPKAAAEGIRKAFKEHGVKLRSRSEAASLSARGRGARAPALSERDRWLEGRYRLLLRGFNYRQKHGRLADAGMGFVRASGDPRVLEKIGRYFGRDPWEAFVVAVEVAALDDPDGPPAEPHTACRAAEDIVRDRRQRALAAAEAARPPVGPGPARDGDGQFERVIDGPVLDAIVLCLEAGATTAGACAAVGVTASGLGQARRRDCGLDLLVRDARARGVALLELVAYGRAIDGWWEPRFDCRGRIVGYRHRLSIKLLLRVLETRIPQWRRGYRPQPSRPVSPDVKAKLERAQSTSCLERLFEALVEAGIDPNRFLAQLQQRKPEPRGAELGERPQRTSVRGAIGELERQATQYPEQPAPGAPAPGPPPRRQPPPWEPVRLGPARRQRARPPSPHQGAEPEFLTERLDWEQPPEPVELWQVINSRSVMKKNPRRY